MAIRMQQRRGTSEQWTIANPTLAPGEIGFETDTNKFKMGDGVNQWADLSYFVDIDALDLGGSLDDYVPLTAVGSSVASLVDGKVPSSQLPNIDELSQDAVNAALTAGSGISKNYDDNANTLTLSVDTGVVATKSYVDDEIAAIPAPDYTGLATETFVGTAIANLVDTAPEALNTLNELANALGDDENFATTISTSLGNKQDKVAGVSDTEIGYLDGVQGNVQDQLDDKSELGHTHTFTDITDTQISSPTSGQALVYNGTKWTNQNASSDPMPQILMLMGA
jgi:hypothetical protein